MTNEMLIAKGQSEFCLIPKMINRHGLIAGATGTGKTVTLQTMAENLSANGVAVFLADIKGDLSGICQRGTENPKITERVNKLGIPDFQFEQFPVSFWDVWGQKGHPVRATVSDMGPLLLGRLLNLNDVQQGVLTVVFKIADDQGLLLLDLKDLRSMVQNVGDNSQEFTTQYGNISKASIGTIQRGLMELSTQGADKFFGEPMLDIFDLIQTDTRGKGMINVLAADQLITRPKVYATFLLWLMSELFEQLPEVGDLEKPKFVFFFDEAHLLFEDIPSALLDKIEQVVRLIRSKGVGIYFITQNPKDIPDKVLAQLGNRVQHALRAFTPKDQKDVKAMAATFRSNPQFNIEKVITELAVGEALVSFLDEQGTPNMTERALVLPPHSRIGTITPEERKNIIESSIHYGHYENTVDRESAFEMIQKRTVAKTQATQGSQPLGVPPTLSQRPSPGYSTRQPRSRADDMVGAFAKSTMRSIGSQVGRQIVRGVLGSILGKGGRF